MDGLVAPVLHNNDPVNPVAVNKELPQLFEHVMPEQLELISVLLFRLPGALVHPFTVCVTVYVPALLL